MLLSQILFFVQFGINKAFLRNIFLSTNSTYNTNRKRKFVLLYDEISMSNLKKMMMKLTGPTDDAAL